MVLSEEWKGGLEEDPASTPEPVATVAAEAAPVPAQAIPAQEDETRAQESAIETAMEEIRFYLGHSMPEEAREAMVKLKQLKPDPATLATVRAEVEAAIIHAALAQDEISVAEEAEVAPEPPARVATPARSKPGAIKGFSDLRPAHETSIPKPPKVAPPPEPEIVEDAVEAVEAASAGILGEFLSELEESLGDEFMFEAPIRAVQPAPPPAPKELATHVAPQIGRASCRERV